MIGNDFIEWTQLKTSRCSECNKVMLAGTKALASIRKGRVQKKICSEECRLVFDDKFWQSVAESRSR
jgi:hypothetical protein